MKFLIFLIFFPCVSHSGIEDIQASAIIGEDAFVTATLQALKKLAINNEFSKAQLNKLSYQLKNNQLIIKQSLPSDHDYIEQGCGKTRFYAVNIPVIVLKYSNECYENYSIAKSIIHEFHHIQTGKLIIGDYDQFNHTVLTNDKLPYNISKLLSAMIGGLDIESFQPNSFQKLSDHKIEGLIDHVEFTVFNEARSFIDGNQLNGPELNTSQLDDQTIVDTIHTVYLKSKIPKPLVEKLFLLSKNTPSYITFVSQLDDDVKYKKQFKQHIQQFQISSVSE